MKIEITIPDHFPVLKEEDQRAATKRRERYSLVRDLQAKEFNEAIASRLAKDKDKPDSSQSESKRQIICEKCDKKFSVEITAINFMNCPECGQNIKIE